jgi:hypothetical protein
MGVMSLNKIAREILIGLSGMMVGSGAVWGHPADGDLDGRISGQELAAHAAAWADGLVTDALYRRAVFIWQAGEQYREIAGPQGGQQWVPDPVGGPVYAALEADRLRPFGLVEVFGIGAGEGLVAQFRVDDLPGSWPARLAVEDDRIRVVVPLNPLSLKGEGTVWLTIENRGSGETWRLPPLQLQGLEPGAGAAQQLLQQIGSAMGAAGKVLGIDVAAYRGQSLEAVPAAARPLVYMDALLRDPANPDSLERIVGERLAPGELAVLESLIAATGMDQPLVPGISLIEAQQAAEQAEGELLPMSSCTGNAFINISSPAKLSVLMKAQAAAQQQISGSGSTLGRLERLRDANDFASFSEALVNVLKGVKPGSVGPGIGDALAVTLVYAGFFAHFDAGTLPGEFVGFELDVVGPARGYFLEDATVCETATVTGKVSVSSKGYDHMQMLADVVPGGPVPGVPGPDKLYQWINRRFPNIDILNTEPDVWCDIPMPVGNADFTTESVGIVFNKEGYNGALRGLDFKPALVGEGEIKVDIRAEPFGGKTSRASIAYATRPIRVNFESPQTLVTGSEASVTYRVRFSDAEQVGASDIEWQVGAGTILSQRTLGGGLYELDWKPSSIESDYPVAISAKAVTTKCLRGESAVAQRQDTISVELDEWKIVPQVSCVDPGQQEVFSIDVGGGDPPVVVWSLVSGGGSIHPDTGLFTAGTEGEVTIRATNADTNEFKERSFFIGCGLTASLLLPPVIPGAGDSASLFGGGFSFDLGAMIVPDMVITFETVTYPADLAPLAVASGRFSGAGIYIDGENRVDDSQSFLTYPVTGSDGQPATNFVAATFSQLQLLEGGKSVELVGGADGEQMRIELSADGSLAAGENNVIVAYNWSFSDGDFLVGEAISKTFDRSLQQLEVTLEVRDRFGYSAIYRETFLIVRFGGTFALPINPAGLQVSCFPWTSPGAPPPPFFFGDGYFVQRSDPAVCSIELIASGARNITATASNSASGLVEDYYSIGFLSLE